jgi:predicted MFS family arabinose efflux permease
MGILTSFEYIAYPLLGLFAGVMVDRWRRRPVLVWTNIFQFLALGSIPIAYALGVLSIFQLFIVTLAMSVTTVFFATAYAAYLPTLVGRENILEGNSKMETSNSAATVMGPMIAGWIIPLLGAATSVAVDAISTLTAAFAILSIKKPEPDPPNSPGRQFRGELMEGVRCVTETPSLRNLLAATSVLNIGNGMFNAVFFLFIYDELKISVQLAAITLAVGAVGFVVGALTASPLMNRVGLGAALVVALLINGIGRLAVQASIYGPVLILLAGLWFIANIGIPIYNINQVSFRQAIVADKLQGRLNAMMRTFGYGAVALGALIGGALASAFGILSAMNVGALIALVPVLLLSFGPIGKIKFIQPVTG